MFFWGRGVKSDGRSWILMGWGCNFVGNSPGEKK